MAIVKTIKVRVRRRDVEIGATLAAPGASGVEMLDLGTNVDRAWMVDGGFSVVAAALPFPPIADRKRLMSDRRGTIGSRSFPDWGMLMRDATPP